MKLLLFAVFACAAALSESQFDCDVCVDLFTLAEKYINGSTAQIFQRFDEVCQYLPNGTYIDRLCNEIAMDAAKQGAQLESLIATRDYGAENSCAFLSYCTIECCDGVHPQQIHISLTSDPTVMMVVYVTPVSVTDQPTVLYSQDANDLSSIAYANVTTFTECGWLGRINVAMLSGLQPSSRYYYSVGSKQSGFSEVNSFRVGPYLNQTKPLRILQIADFGGQGYQNFTLPRLIELAESDAIDVILHVGDIAYSDGVEVIMDQFLRDLQPVYSRIPTMFTPGNHEIIYNFTSYRHRFPMPVPIVDGVRPMFWSINLDNVHLIGMNTESEADSAWITDAELEWLAQDLKIANQNRAAQPWIIAMGHRPLYCSATGGSFNDSDCFYYAKLLRAKLEEMFYENHVDLVLSGHKHCYQRTWPVYKGVPESSYDSPRSPVYVMNGAAGDREGQGHGWIEPTPSWSYTYNSAYGYGILEADDDSLTYSFYNDTDDSIIDQFTITRSSST